MRRKILLTALLLSTIALFGFMADDLFYLTNKAGTVTIIPRYTIDQATLTNANISLPGALAGTSLQINGGTVLTGQVGTGTNIFTDGGITNGANAAAGKIGEYVIAKQTTGQVLTSNTPLTLASVALTAGEWEIKTAITFLGTTTVATQQDANISTTTNALTTIDGARENESLAAQATVASGITLVAQQRVNISGSQTYFAVANCVFGSGTCTAQGYIRAQRIR